jgi:hypothetical protein
MYLRTFTITYETGSEVGITIFFQAARLRLPWNTPLSKPSDTDTTSKDVASYSAIVKNKTDPAIIIKPKDST